MLEFCVIVCNQFFKMCVSNGYNLQSKQKDRQDQEQVINDDDDQKLSVNEQNLAIGQGEGEILSKYAREKGRPR